MSRARVLAIVVVLVAVYVLIPRGSAVTSEADPHRSRSVAASAAPSLVTGAPLPPSTPAESVDRLAQEEGLESAAAPQPTGGIGQPASYFKPTPQPRIVDGISGSITWYPRTRGYGDTATVALPDGHYIPAGRPVPYAVVCIVLDGNSRCATLPVVDCLCAGSSRIADLSLGAVRLLKLDPSTGIWHGTVERLP